MTEQRLLRKIRQLPPEKAHEVENFIDFLTQQNEAQSDRQLTQAATRLSSEAFARVWDNPEDAVYDNL